MVIFKNSDEDTDIYKPGPRERYYRRPQTPEFNDMLYPDDITNYNVQCEKPKTKSPPQDMDLNYVIRRTKSLVIRTHFTTPLDGESFFLQPILLKVPFRSTASLISESNNSGNYKEECFLRGLFDAQDEFDVRFQDMKYRNFDPLHIAKIAKQMLHTQLSDRKTLDQKLVDLDYCEPIPFCDSEIDSYQTVLMEPSQVPMDVESAEEQGVSSLLGVNKESIIRDKLDLNECLKSLTSC